MTTITFRPYHRGDYDACMHIFDTNCPLYLAPGERQDYESFLDSSPAGYEVCEVDGRISGVFGLLANDDGEIRLNWIMVDSNSHGTGLGARIMERVLQLARRSGATAIGLSTTQKIAPFFTKYGAATMSMTKDGYGPGLDCVDMVLRI